MTYKRPLSKRIRFWWYRSCLRYGHFGHKHRLGPLSCTMHVSGHWLGCHTALGRWMAGRRLERMERRWAKQRAAIEAGKVPP